MHCGIITTVKHQRNNGFLTPNIVKERIRSYSLSNFAKENSKDIISKING